MISYLFVSEFGGDAESDCIFRLKKPVCSCVLGSFIAGVKRTCLSVRGRRNVAGVFCECVMNLNKGGVCRARVAAFGVSLIGG